MDDDQRDSSLTQTMDLVLHAKKGDDQAFNRLFARYYDRIRSVVRVRMGARLRKQGPSQIIHGVDSLTGAEVMASDLRGGAALIVAALAARGTTTVHRVYHVDRGYEGIEKKLSALGARIDRIEVS